MEITKDTVIGDLLMEDYSYAVVLMGSGMHCVGCPASQMETIEEACAVHGMDCEQVVNALKEYSSAKDAE
ncbi:MAG: DUF1858 domain-containing protein [Lachnospiraceae bacterium]|nr:DUF1858 domain-containing protein [Lachnospiraceae bacterium]